MSNPFNEFDLFGEVPRPNAASVLRDKFIMPPFSVLSARDGDWQERKRKWLALGIKSEVGRGDILPGGGAEHTPRQLGSVPGAGMTGAGRSFPPFRGGRRE
jgi:hypothetical protein